MTIYMTTLYASLEQSLTTVTISSRFIKNALYCGPFADIPECLFNKEVVARLYEKRNNSLTLWI